MPLLNPDCLVAQTGNLLVTVRNNQNGYTMLLDELRNAILTLLLEHEIANGQNLVYYENFGDDNRGDGKRDTRHHARRVVLQRHV